MGLMNWWEQRKRNKLVEKMQAQAQKFSIGMPFDKQAEPEWWDVLKWLPSGWDEETKTKKIFEALENEIDRQACGNKRIRISGVTKEGLRIMVTLDKTEERIIIYYPLFRKTWEQ